ncbi:hypothetical protein PENTCL1PPCAC_21540 [Pristionchus entomophagus]|uniref:CUB domain-containing protein n=1 Tax=Pristionchus entomophagus TaxID=358040 RepID=A0AAV5TXV4_9BILA|nr:hypothetical protein PENTCL1PPCAC_21540 [Pristionchus entomophagus]
MLRLLLSFTILHFSQSLCPNGFDLVSTGECRGYYARAKLDHTTALDKYVAKCGEMQAKPIKIQNAEQQSYWMNRVGEYPGDVVIGLMCNTTSKSVQWYDGTGLDYLPPNGIDEGSSCSPRCIWYLWENSWKRYCTTDGINSSIYCTTQLQQPIPSANGCDDFESDEDDGVCYQIADAESWQEAQKSCRSFGADLASIHSLKENSFIRRLAVSRGAVTGLFLGATASGKGNDFKWVDGTDWDYQNFYAGFPVAGLGDCLVMDTAGSTAGEWVNTDCSTKLPAACVRQPNNHTCTTGPWKEGEIISSPGFPYDASLACDFMFSVPVGKRVELEVIFLEANSCCDNLVLYENYLGAYVIATLTGEMSNKVYSTSSSNFMRVSWNPNGGVNVKGMQIKYRAV